MGFTSVVKVKNAAEMALELIQRHYPDYHPLTALARMAHDDNVRCDPKIELEVHKAILPYVAPKLAQQEVNLNVLDDRRVVVTLFEEVALENGAAVPVEIPYTVDVEDIVPLDK